MHYGKLFGLSLFALILAGILVFSGNRTNRNAENTTTMKNMQVIGWIPYWDQKNAFTSFLENSEAFDYISVFWYKLDPTGKITTYQQAVEDTIIIDEAHRKNVKVLALIANMPDDNEQQKDWDPKRVNKVISSKDARKKHIHDLLQIVQAKKFDGISLDYEYLRGEQREDFSTFVEELGGALHKEGKILGVTIHPKTGEFLPTQDNGSHAQDLVRLAKAADHLYFMTYLEHGTFSSPGSIGSIPWIRGVVGYAIHNLHLPREKIFLGIGVFGVEWKRSGDKSYAPIRDDITFGEIYDIVQRTNTQVQWDNTTKSPYITYEKNGQEHIIWFENAISVKDRIALAKEYNVGGLAFWRLHSEDPAIWSDIKNVKKPQ